MSKKPTPLSAIRSQCLSCMGGHEDGYTDTRGKWCPPYRPVGLVRDCPSKDCSLYPFRFGTDPRRKPKTAAASLEALAAARKKRAKTRSEVEDGKQVGGQFVTP